MSHGEDGTDAEQRQLILSEAQREGYTKLFEEHQKEMKSFWNNTSVEIKGITGEEEAAVRFAQYHILGLTPWHTNECSIAAKGLTGEGYKGHVFWDTEIFILPFLLHTYPSEARRLLEFRYKGWKEQEKKPEILDSGVLCFHGKRRDSGCLVESGTNKKADMRFVM